MINDNWRAHCAACGAVGELHNHHLIPQSLGGKRLPTIKLCGRCHATVHAFGKAIYFNHRELTLAGLARARAAGKKLGNPNLRKGDRESAARARAARTAKANAQAVALAPTLEAAKAEGPVSLRQVAAYLVAHKVRTPTGKRRWHPEQVRTLARRCGVALP